MMENIILSLEDRVRAELAGLDAKMCVYADDLKGNRVEIGADEIFESASVIKIFVLGALFDLIEKGKARPDDLLTYRKDLYVDGSGVIRSLGTGARFRVSDAASLMIIYSDNIATNMLIEYLGLDTVNEYIRRIGCSQTILHRRLYSEGEHGRLGTITPRDMGRFFTLLANGELAGEQSIHEMRRILRQQQYREMIADLLPPYYLPPATSENPGNLFYAMTKSGSMDDARNDGGLIHTPYGEYVIVMMCTGFTNTMEVRDHPAFLYGSRVSRLIFDHYLALQGHF